MNISSREIAYLDVIRDTVSAYLQGPVKNPEKTTIAKTVSRCLSQCTPGMEINAFWESARDPYCAAIYPDIDELNMKSDQLIYILDDKKGTTVEYLDAWCSIKHWNLMLDPRILTKGNQLCCDDGEQFVALLCHELGHVMSRDPVEFVKTFKEQKHYTDKVTLLALHKSPIIRTLILPVFVATSNFKIIVKDPNRHGDLEYAADAFVPEEYKGALISYMDNHILKSTAQSDLIKTEAEYRADQETAVAFSRQALELMTRRRNVLKGRLRGASVAAPNTYFKELIDYVSRKVAGYEASVDKADIITENRIVQQLENQLATMEAMQPVSEAIKVTDRELSLLEIDVDSIESTDDKLWCIQTIYDYMDAVTADQKKKFKNIKSDEVLEKEMDKDTRMDTLQRLRKKVMDTQIDDSSRYGVFVKYPKGYEG